ncbi:MAG: CDP-diacylglycerol--glycerol-3-phosphate 3-phosphatidyltransferase [bacterium]
MIEFWRRSNLATRLTIVRIFLVPVFIAFMYHDNFYTRICALLIFISAGITDLYDGAIARRTKTVTTLGTFLDPLADKLMICAVFISFVEHPDIRTPAWMVVFIISREFIITGMRSVAASQDKIIPADKGGKFKTAIQTSAIITIFIILINNAMLDRFWDINVNLWIYALNWKRYLGLVLLNLPYWLMFIVTITTIYSGISYVYKNEDILFERRSAKR